MTIEQSYINLIILPKKKKKLIREKSTIEKEKKNSYPRKILLV